MPSSLNWTDGSSGGTPLSAANLNRLAVIADVGTPGTPTGDAVRATNGGIFTPEMYGAKGDGVTDDAAAVQAAIDAANNGGGIAANTAGGGTVRFAAKTYLIGSTLTLYGGIHLRGAGPGGDVFSGTDAQLPYRGTALRLKSGANTDLIKTANFATLTGTTAPSAYAVPNRFGLYDLTLDGNKAGNTSGRCLVIYGRSYWLQNVVIQNAPGDGFHSEYGTTAGYDNEAQISNLRVTDVGGNGVNFLGPHDSTLSNVFCARNGGSGIVAGTNAGSLLITNMHNWGNSAYNFDIGCGDSSWMNCVSDGAGGTGLAGVRVTASDVRWMGGSIYGTNTAGEILVQIGDGTTALTLQGVDFFTRWFNLNLGSLPLRYMNGVTSNYANRFAGPIEASTNSRLIAGQGRTTVSGAQTLPSSTLTVADTSSFPSSGTLYIGIPGVGTAVSTYTGKTATTFTGVSGDSLAVANGSVVWQQGSSSPHDTIMLRSADGGGLGYLQFGSDLGGSSLFMNQPVVFVAPPSFNNGTDLTFGSGAGSRIGTATAQKLAFYGSTPVARPVLSYSRSGAGETAAVAALRAALAALGLVTDSTTA